LAINSAFMALYAFAMTLVVWVLWAYKLAFGVYMLPFVGRPGPVVKISQELRQSNIPSTGASQAFPLSTMIYFQFVFAAITIIIVAGALLGRMNFTAWMVLSHFGLRFVIRLARIVFGEGVSV
jgi:Amt family ammonium transporter